MGFWQFSISVTSGSISETTHKQSAADLDLDPRKWQWSIISVQSLLGATGPGAAYCPAVCPFLNSCRDSCIAKPTGTKGPVMRVFGTHPSHHPLPLPILPWPHTLPIVPCR